MLAFISISSKLYKTNRSFLPRDMIFTIFDAVKRQRTWFRYRKRQKTKDKKNYTLKYSQKSTLICIGGKEGLDQFCRKTTMGEGSEMFFEEKLVALTHFYSLHMRQNEGFVLFLSTTQRITCQQTASMKLPLFSHLWTKSVCSLYN